MKPMHFAVLIVVLIIIFGAAKLPDIARNIGKSAKILKKEMKELTEDETNPPIPAVSQASIPPAQAAAPQTAQTQQMLHPQYSVPSAQQPAPPMNPTQPSPRLQPDPQPQQTPEKLNPAGNDGTAPLS
ncbi:Sec-independent protein translocase subunit TatA [Arcanobacterium hippocoleae]